MTSPTAALIVIGSEILSGKVQDENTPFIARELRRLGVALMRVVVIPDDVPVIAREVAEASRAHTWVFTTGGVGPTHDDVTMEAVARAFGRSLVPSTELVEHLQRAKRGRAPEALIRLCTVPEGAGLVWGEGERVWPTVHIDNVYIFPGVPAFLRARFADLQGRLLSAPFVSSSVYCAWSETDLVERINAAVAGWPDVAIGSYPEFARADYRVRITFDGKSRAAVDGATDAFLASLPDEALVRVERPS